MAWPSPRWGHQPAGRQRQHLAGLREALQGWDGGALVTAPSAGGCTLVWPRGHQYLLRLLCWGHLHLPVPVLLCPPCLWLLEHPRSCWGSLGLQGWPWGARGSHPGPGEHSESWAPGQGGWDTHVWKSRLCSPGNTRGEGVGGPSTAPGALPSLPPGTHVAGCPGGGRRSAQPAETPQWPPASPPPPPPSLRGVPRREAQLEESGYLSACPC